MQTQPKISIVIATYDAGRSLQTCLDSAAGQACGNKEIIVIDGASSDNTCDIIRSNSNRAHYWESAPNQGIYHACNKALDHVTGDWIHFVGADERYMASDVFEQLAPTLKQTRGNGGLVSSPVHLDGTQLPVYQLPAPNMRDDVTLRGAAGATAA